MGFNRQNKLGKIGEILNKWLQRIHFGGAIVFICLYVASETIRPINQDTNDKKVVELNALGKVIEKLGMYSISFLMKYPERIDDGWVVIRGLTQNMAEVNVLTNQPLSWDRPFSMTQASGGFRWQRFLRHAFMTDFWQKSPEYISMFSKNLCNLWNLTESHKDAQITEIEVYRMHLSVKGPNQDQSHSEPKKVRLFGSKCNGTRIN